jgi:uncharacterized protein (DUF1330 family)
LGGWRLFASNLGNFVTQPRPPRGFNGSIRAIVKMPVAQVALALACLGGIGGRGIYAGRGRNNALDCGRRNETRESDMPKAYWVVTYRSVKNPEAWQAYAKLAAPAINAAGGRMMIRAMPAKTYEAGVNERVVVVEFDSLDKALAAHDTPAYQEALKALGTGNIERDMRVVEGVA